MIRRTPSKSRGNTKYWILKFPLNADLHDIDTFLGQLNSVADRFLKKTKTHINVFLKLKKRINIRSNNYFNFEGSNLEFKKSNANIWKDYEEPPTMLEKIQQVIKKEKMSKKDFIETPMLIKHATNLEKTLKLLKGSKKQKTSPQNMFGDYPIDFESKQKHFYIHGPPNTGKTTYWKTHIKEFNLGPQNNDWRFFDTEKQFIIFDEWTSEIAKNVGVENLNRLMDGKCLLNTKGSTIEIKNQHILIFCSNFEPKKTIPKELLDSFLTRVKVIRFGT